jgi:hypothetical protein
MAARVSILTVRQAWMDYVNAAASVGFDVNGWNFQEGSLTNGVHYSARMADGRPVPGAISEGMNTAFLGTTQGETYNALRHMIAVMRAVRDLNN